MEVRSPATGARTAGTAVLLMVLLSGCTADAHPPDDGFSAPSASSPRPASAEGGRAVDLPEVPRRKPAAAASFTGLASWYGRDFHGRTTASGEPYDMAALTAAHQTLPFGSRVRVTNLANGRWVVVVINDRGPYAADRLIDLSHAAARRLGILEDGLAKVRLDVLGDVTEVAG